MEGEMAKTREETEEERIFITNGVIINLDGSY